MTQDRLSSTLHHTTSPLRPRVAGSEPTRGTRAVTRTPSTHPTTPRDSPAGGTPRSSIGEAGQPLTVWTVVNHWMTQWMLGLLASLYLLNY